jgi:Xaa-Pro aminopeptidase
MEYSVLYQTQKENRMNKLFSAASKITQIPGLHLLAPSANRVPTLKELEGYQECQRLAQKVAKEVAALLEVGILETEAAELMDSKLESAGVQSFFHKSFVWFGERTRFEGVKKYRDYLPTPRKLQEGDVYILDVAPILNGYISDIGYSGVFGESEEFDQAMEFLRSLREDIPSMFDSARSGGEVWRAIDQKFIQANYDNIHAKYPFSVLGHRVHTVPSEKPNLNFVNFGWQSYWSLLSRGLFGQLLNQDFEGDLLGLWAIEPHIGTKDFGAKFEEILVVDENGARWLEETMA